MIFNLQVRNTSLQWTKSPQLVCYLEVPPYNYIKVTQLRRRKIYLVYLKLTYVLDTPVSAEMLGSITLHSWLMASMWTVSSVLKKLSSADTLKTVPVELESAVIMNLRIASSCTLSVFEGTVTLPSLGKE